MATKTLLTQIKLRRDNDYIYNAKKTTFIPLKGEVCLVDMAVGGLRAKVGNGVDTWENLPFTDESILSAIDAIVQRGYLYEGKFYSDSSHTQELTASTETIYIEAAKSQIYTYDGTKYVGVNDNLPNANSSTAGILKLYNTTGDNTDGTMTQKIITEELGKKVSVSVNDEEEMIIFS